MFGCVCVSELVCVKNGRCLAMCVSELVCVKNGRYLALCNVCEEWKKVVCEWEHRLRNWCYVCECVCTDYIISAVLCV